MGRQSTNGTTQWYLWSKAVSKSAFYTPIRVCMLWNTRSVHSCSSLCEHPLLLGQCLFLCHLHSAPLPTSGRILLECNSTRNLHISYKQIQGYIWFCECNGALPEEKVLMVFRRHVGVQVGPTGPCKCNKVVNPPSAKKSAPLDVASHLIYKKWNWWVHTNSEQLTGRLVSNVADF